MNLFFDEIKAKIRESLNPEKLVLIDNSHLHSKHKSFDKNKFHLKIIIKSKKLKNMEKIKSHKLILSILKNEINNKIHALEIVVE
tara:strand:- start:149 stop:403 length:255 start_codon:yes stop_codon:yes gene_type:complete